MLNFLYLLLNCFSKEQDQITELECLISQDLSKAYHPPPLKYFFMGIASMVVTIVLSIVWTIYLKGYVPVVYRHEPFVFFMQILSDSLISVSYFVIPLALVLLVRLRSDLPFNWIFWMFATFILSCGCTHLFHVVTPWTNHTSIYVLEVAIKFFTALISLITAINSIRLIPLAMNLPSPAQLASEINQRKLAQRKVKKQYDRMLNLSNALKRIRNSINYQEILSTACEEIVNLFHVSDAAIYSSLKMNGDGFEPELPCSACYTGCSSDRQSLPLCPFIRSILHSEEPATYTLSRSSGDEQNENQLLDDFMIKNGAKKIVCISVGYQGVPRAVLLLFGWSLSERTILEEVAGQLGIALQHSVINEQLTIDRDQAQKTSVEKTAFLLMMSHEVKTPLHAINGMNTLLKATNLTPEQQECVKIIDESGDLLLGIINSFLDLSKLESNKLILEKSEFNLHSCLDSAVHLFVMNAKSQKNISVKMNRDPWLPLYAIGDRYRIQQILINLLSNAVKFTEANGRVSVQAVCKDSGPEAPNFFMEVTVKDTGIGMNEEQISKLFQPFSQVHSSGNRRKFGGTGLGLAICKKLCNLMNGDVTVSSQIGVGSVFTFSVQLEKMPDEKKLASPRKRSTAVFQRRDSIGAKYTNILIAEDNIINQRVAVAMLRKLGYQNIEVVGNGKLAVEAVRRKNLNICVDFSPYDIILCDLQMPELDGNAAVVEIRKMIGRPDFPYIIALTANVQENIEKECLQSGFNAFLSKPFKIDVLDQVLKQAPALQEPLKSL